MAWLLSRFRAGEIVEVRSKEEILATLDSKGCFDGMPFMPEMLPFCGQQVKVRAVAHKTCDTIHGTGGRRVQSAVHLEAADCDGSAHGGCQARCSLFWKDAWLKPIKQRASSEQAKARETSNGCFTEADLHFQTRQPEDTAGEEPRYICQVTRLFDATSRLRRWDFRQYLFDIITGNRSAVCVIRALALAALHRLVVRTPVGYRILNSVYGRAHRLVMRRPAPHFTGGIPLGKPTPTQGLQLQTGELVRVKSKAEIEKTLDENGNNRGLGFDKEMAPYCGRLVRVRTSVDRILEESTGKMRHMKQPCVILDGVVCNGDYAESRLMCPRAIPSYWREIWLERVGDAPDGSPANNDIAVPVESMAGPRATCKAQRQCSDHSVR